MLVTLWATCARARNWPGIRRASPSVHFFNLASLHRRRPPPEGTGDLAILLSQLAEETCGPARAACAAGRVRPSLGSPAGALAQELLAAGIGAR
jgi:hypothetical protein